MLLIKVKVVAGVFTEEQKQQMARRVTADMVAMAGENRVVIEEIRSGQQVIGGELDSARSGDRSGPVEVGIQHPHFHYAVYRQIVARGGTAYRLRIRRVTHTEAFAVIEAHVGVDPGHPVIGVVGHHQAA
jgi:phenylpyruvate tautomerase PptA (4-oxalocrotonate tautomerase family)